MRLRKAFLAIILLLSACGELDPAKNPNIFTPPDPEKQSVAFIETRRELGVLGAMQLMAVAGKQALDPAAIDERRLPEVYRNASRRRTWTDGTETVFLAVPVGQQTLGYWYLPGMTLRGMNPFSPGATIVPVALTAELQNGRYYRANGEEGPTSQSYRVWLENIDTGETVASVVIK
jgi:hypothetical protein